MTDEVIDSVEEEFDLDIEIDNDVVETNDESVDETPTTYKLKYKDKEFDLPKELENKVIPLDEYTKKTQAIAEERKQLEVMKTELAQAKAKQIEYDQVVVEKTYKVKSNEALLEKYEGIDWDNEYAINPTEAVKHQFKMQQLKAEQHKLVKEIVDYNQSKQDSYHQTRQQEVEAELVKLYEEIPDWDKQVPLIAEYTRSIGIPDEVLGSTTDSKACKVLSDAAKWNRYVKAKEAKEQGSKVTTVRSQGKGTSNAVKSPSSDEAYMRSVFKK